MARYVLLFQSNVVAGRDTEFTAWNESVGMPGILGIEGFSSAERFVLCDRAGAPPEYPFRHRDAYDVATNDTDYGVQKIRDRQAAEKSDAVTTAGILVTVFKPLGPRL